MDRFHLRVADGRLNRQFLEFLQVHPVKNWGGRKGFRWKGLFHAGALFQQDFVA
jgi:hypothetical protein